MNDVEGDGSNGDHEAVVDEEWRRLHPASPIVRGWQPLVAVLAIGVQDGLDPDNLAFTGGLALAVVVVAATYYWLAWRVARFRIDGVDVVVENGVVFKRSRRVPLARLQAVDVVQPLLARALGLAELRLEVAGGKSSDASLAYLEHDVARVARNELLALAAGLRSDVSIEPAPPEASEIVIARTSSPMLVASTLVSGTAPLVVVIVGGAVVVAAFTGEPGVAFGVVVPLVFGVGGQVWTSFSRSYGAAVAEAADGLRLRHGLLETRSQTVPPGRVQGVVLHEPLVWRIFGWMRLAATVAGYAGSSDSSPSTTLLPVATHDVGRRIVASVLPGVDWDTVALQQAPRRSRWRAPIEAARLRAGVGDEGAERVLVTIRGRFGQRTDVVPLARVQSVRLRQGPVQRLLHLATVHADVSPGPVKAAALHRDEREARRLVDQLVSEGRAARAAARPDRWMAGPA